MHGKAQLSDGPTPDTTTVSIQGHLAPGLICCCWMCAPTVQTVLKSLSAKGPARFRAGEFQGPQLMEQYRL